MNQTLPSHIESRHKGSNCWATGLVALLLFGPVSASSLTKGYITSNLSVAYNKTSWLTPWDHGKKYTYHNFDRMRPNKSLEKQNKKLTRVKQYPRQMKPYFCASSIRWKSRLHYRMQCCRRYKPLPFPWCPILEDGPSFLQIAK